MVGDTLVSEGSLPGKFAGLLVDPILAPRRATEADLLAALASPGRVLESPAGMRRRAVA